MGETMLDFKCSECNKVHIVSRPQSVGAVSKVPCVCGHIMQVTKVDNDFEVYEIGTFYAPSVAAPVYYSDC